MEKICTNCGEKYFSPKGNSKYCYICKHAMRKKSYSEYYYRNRDNCLASRKKYYESHKEKVLDQNRKYVIENKEKVRAKQREYAKNNVEIYREHHRRYREKNREKIYESNKIYKATSIRNNTEVNCRKQDNILERFGLTAADVQETYHKNLKCN